MVIRKRLNVTLARILSVIQTSHHQPDLINGFNKHPKYSRPVKLSRLTENVLWFILDKIRRATHHDYYWISYLQCDITLSYCHPLILSSSHTVVLSSSHTIILSSCHTVILSYCHPVILSYCHPVICHPVILSRCMTANTVPTIETFSRKLLHPQTFQWRYKSLLVGWCSVALSESKPSVISHIKLRSHSSGEGFTFFPRHSSVSEFKITDVFSPPTTPQSRNSHVVLNISTSIVHLAQLQFS